MLRHESLIRLGLAGAILSVVLVAVVPLDSALRTLFGVSLLIGWCAAAWALHRYGRAG